MKPFSRTLAVSISLCFLPSFALAEPVTLEQAWIDAYQRNPSLEAERAKLRATDEDVAKALSHWRPTLDANSSVGKTYQRIPEQDAIDEGNFSGNTTSYGVQATQPLFRGFRTLSETEAAKKQVKAGRAQLQDAEEKLLLDTATAFLDIVRDEANLVSEKNYETVLRKNFDETSARARAGELTNTDIQQSQSRISRAEVARLQTENALQADRDAYQRLVGDEPTALVKPQLVLDRPGDLDELMHIADTRSPSVVAAQYAMEQADAQVKLDAGSLAPELDLVAGSSRNYGENAITPGRYDQSEVMLQLKVPLYDSGSDYANVRQARQTAVQRRMELEEARHKAHETAHNAWQMLQITSAAIKSDKIEIEAANHALAGVKAQSRVGTRTILDVLNAEQELLDAKTDLEKSEHDRNLAVLQIKSALGELTADALKLPIEPYHPEQHYDDNHAKWVGIGSPENDIYANPQKILQPTPISDEPTTQVLVMPPQDMELPPPEKEALAVEKPATSAPAAAAALGSTEDASIVPVSAPFTDTKVVPDAAPLPDAAPTTAVEETPASPADAAQN